MCTRSNARFPLWFFFVRGRLPFPTDRGGGCSLTGRRPTLSRATLRPSRFRTGNSLTILSAVSHRSFRFPPRSSTNTTISSTEPSAVTWVASQPVRTLHCFTHTTRMSTPSTRGGRRRMETRPSSWAPNCARGAKRLVKCWRESAAVSRTKVWVSRPPLRGPVRQCGG
jgi:hypothetical protein